MRMNNARNNTNTFQAAGPGEGNGEETPQVSNSIFSAEFLAAKGPWLKLATAESTYRFLEKAQNLGVNTNDVFFFLNNQGNMRKIKTNVKPNSTLCLKHDNIASELMSFKVAP